MPTTRVKITELPVSSGSLDSDDVVLVVEDGVTKQATPANALGPVAASVEDLASTFGPFDTVEHSVIKTAAVSTTYWSCPDAAALDIVGDLTIVACVQPRYAMSGGAQSTVMSKWESAADKGYALSFVNRTLRLYWSPDLTTTVFKDSTANVTLNQDVWGWVAATLDVDNGATGNTVRFWQSVDGIAWTQVGTSVVTAGVTSIAANTKTLLVGQLGISTGGPFTGAVKVVSVRSGIGASGVPGGTEVARFDVRDGATFPMEDRYRNVWTETGTDRRRTTAADTGHHIAKEVFVAPYPCRVLSVSLTTSTDVTASDTNYWTATLRRASPTLNTIAAKTTKTTGGQAMVARTDWNFDAIPFDTTYEDLAKGQALTLTLEATGTVPNLRDVCVTVRVEPA